MNIQVPQLKTILPSNSHIPTPSNNDNNKTVPQMNGNHEQNIENSTPDGTKIIITPTSVETEKDSIVNKGKNNHNSSDNKRILEEIQKTMESKENIKSKNKMKFITKIKIFVLINSILWFIFGWLIGFLSKKCYN